MKKIVLLLSLVLCSIVSFSQFVNTQTVASATTDYKSKGGLTADSLVHLAPIIFADTTAANYSVVSKYSGAIIQVSNSQIWYRTLTPNQWHLFSSSTGGGFLPLSDTSAMLLPYLRKSDTANLVNPYLRKSDTAFMLASYVRFSDTANLVAPYLRISDTASMLSNYYNKTAADGRFVPLTRTVSTNAPLGGGGALSSDLTLFADTGRANAQIVSGGSLNQVKDSLVALISASGGGTVLSVSTTDGFGIISSVANPTSNPDISIKADTIALPTRYTTDSIAALKVNISDTSSMLSNYLRKTDTLTMLSNYLRKTDTSTMLLPYLRKTDTLTMLAPYLRKTDTSNMLLPYLRKTDTASMLTGYTRVQRFLDTTSTLRTLINTKGTGTVTSVGFIAPSFLTISNSPITSSGNITATLANQNANYGFFGPTSGSPASPTFRAAVIADIPDLSSIYLPIIDTATMLSNYNSGVGYGLIKNEKSPYVDTSFIISYTDTLKINGIATKTDIINNSPGNNYIKNQTSQQSSSNFNIDGTGVVNQLTSNTNVKAIAEGSGDSYLFRGTKSNGTTDIVTLNQTGTGDGALSISNSSGTQTILYNGGGVNFVNTGFPLLINKTIDDSLHHWLQVTGTAYADTLASSTTINSIVKSDVNGHLLSAISGTDYLSPADSLMGGYTTWLLTKKKIDSLAYALSGTGYVPYIGATDSVDLGNYNLTVYGIKIGRGAGNDPQNTVLGRLALTQNTFGTQNVAIGLQSLQQNIVGNNNTGVGTYTLSENLSSFNTAIGAYSLIANTSGYENTSLGYNNLKDVNDGYSNTSIGNKSGSGLIHGSNNTFIGANIGYPIPLDSLLNNHIIISTGDGVSKLLYDSIKWTSSSIINYNASNYESLFTDSTLVTKKYVDSLISSGGSGTVTSIATNNGSGITGGTITTTGTLAIDTSSVISTKLNVLNQLNKYTGTTNTVTVGTIGTGIWQGTPIADSYISSASIWNAKQPALSGTGFVKIAGTTISYDNSTYLTTATAASTYAALSGATFTGNVDMGANIISTESGGFFKAKNGSDYVTLAGLGITWHQGSYATSVVATTPTANRTITLPDQTGTVALTNNTTYVGTTAIALNRTSASQTLTGVSIDGSAALNLLLTGGTLSGQIFLPNNFYYGTKNSSGTNVSLVGLSSSNRVGLGVGAYPVDISGTLDVVGAVTGASFAGAGTGLTGTASGLSIGGNAANITATSNSTITTLSALTTAAGGTFGSNAYTSTAFLPISAGSGNALTGDLFAKHIVQQETYPYLQQLPSGWGSSFYMQSGTNTVGTSGGDYVTYQVPSGKGHSFVINGASVYNIDASGNNTWTGGGTFGSDLSVTKTGQSKLVLGAGTSTNDYGRIDWYGKGTGSGVSLMYDAVYNTQSGSAVGVSVIEVAHEGASSDNKSFYRIFTHNGTSLIEAFRLSSNQAATFGSSVTASSFITSGGTSSQFLKADGSVDGNTYLTSAVTSLTGTTNQVTVSASTGAVTVSLPSAVTISGNMTAAGFFESSDKRLKNYTYQNTSLDGLRTVSFFWKPELNRDNKQHWGYLAQDVEKILPDQVNIGADGYKTVNYIEVLVYKIAQLEKRITQLENKNK